MIEKVELWQNDKKIDDIEIGGFDLEWRKEWHKGFNNWSYHLEIRMEVVLMGNTMFQIYTNDNGYYDPIAGIRHKKLRNPITLKTNEFEIKDLYLFNYSPYFSPEKIKGFAVGIKLVQKS